MTVEFTNGEWAFITKSRQVCQIIDRQTAWGITIYRVWLPSEESVIRVSAKELTRTQDSFHINSLHEITYVASAARIVDSLSRDALVAPLEGKLIPLPHQIHALARAVGGDKVRYLLADEVGLGKTIEAGLIMRELKIRGLVRRTLIVAPTGLVTQWVQEMNIHFEENFRLVLPGEFKSLRQFAGLSDDDNIWKIHNQIICPLDSVKPVDSRRGWTREQLDRYNRERLEDLASANWDLIIFDEAHRLGGSNDQVARYRLGEELAQAAPFLLLLSATPHQGKTDSFRRLMALLDPEVFSDAESITQERVAPYVIRTEKRVAIDTDGRPLFQPRQVQLIPVAWDNEHKEQRELYEAVTEYVRKGYNEALREKRFAIGFLMILMQRLISSSTRAILSALERRLEVLKNESAIQMPSMLENEQETFHELDGQELMDRLLKTTLNGIANERIEVQHLISSARQCETKGPDTKVQSLITLIRKLQREENDPNLKILIFTEFIPTQVMLSEFLTNRGFSVTCLNGSLNLEQRRLVQQKFAVEAQFLISTDAGGEGLNLQFCHVVVNYDLPWNPMKLEQRIGRVDRIGQNHTVTAFNFALEDTVELRMREVLEEKLLKIQEEFGVDKLSDVLDSDMCSVSFDDLYVQAVVNPDQAIEHVNTFAEELRERALEARNGLKVLGAVNRLDSSHARSIANHQIPYWTERMTVSYLQGRKHIDAEVGRTLEGYKLRWPTGEQLECATFDRNKAESNGVTYLSLEDSRVRRLTESLPMFTEGTPIICINIFGISDKVSGIWSLWEISLETTNGRDRRFIPIFTTDKGRVLSPTAQAIWDRLIELDVHDCQYRIVALDNVTEYPKSRGAAEENGRKIYEELLSSHRERVERERIKAQQYFEARNRAISKVGLPQVRQYRLDQLAIEHQKWEAAMDDMDHILPDLRPVAFIRIAKDGEIGD